MIYSCIAIFKAISCRLCSIMIWKWIETSKRCNFGDIKLKDFKKISKSKIILGRFVSCLLLKCQFFNLGARVGL